MKIKEIDIKKIWVGCTVAYFLFFVAICCMEKSEYSIAADSVVAAAPAKQITISRQITLAVNGQDTLWIPLNETIAPNNGVSNDPPDYAGWNGNGRVYIRKVTGTSADSIAVLLKPCDHLGNILKTVTGSTLDTLFAFGTSFTTYANVGNGSTYMRSITGVFDPTMQIAAIIKKADGGTHTLEFSLVKQ